MKSGRDESIDEIRADAISGEYYKYAYHRLPSGDFVQIGISAETHPFWKIRYRRLLDDLSQDPDIDDQPH